MKKYLEAFYVRDLHNVDTKKHNLCLFSAKLTYFMQASCLIIAPEKEN